MIIAVKLHALHGISTDPKDLISLTLPNNKAEGKMILKQIGLYLFNIK
jgi:hypothetical protein